jgi:DNA repair exonuclease SbcCD ATPase subunit
VSEGLTVIRGPNSAGKTTLVTIAPRWCIWGPTAIDDQDNLVRYGERDLGVELEIDMGGEHYVKIWRRFLKHETRDGGVASLKVWTRHAGSAEFVEVSDAKIADTQARINELVGTYAMFATTAYVDQDDGPGAFMKLGGADKRVALREIVVESDDDWDEWHRQAHIDLAVSKDEIVADEARLELLREHAAKLTPTYPPEGFEGEPVFGLLAEEAASHAGLAEADRQVGMAVWNEKITRDFLGAFSDLQTSHNTAFSLSEQAEKLLTDAIERNDQAQEAVKATEAILDKGTEIREAYDAQNDAQDRWEKEAAEVLKTNQENTKINDGRRNAWGKAAKEVSDEISRIQKTHSDQQAKRKAAAKCKECGQPMDVPDALAPIIPIMPKQPMFLETVYASEQPRRNHEIEQQYDAVRHAKDSYLGVKQGLSKADKAVTDAREHFNSIEIPEAPLAFEVENATTAHDVDAKTLSHARAAAAEAQRRTGTAEEAVRAAQAAQTEAETLTRIIDAARKEITIQELLVEKLGPNGVRQLMLDQAIRELEIVCQGVTDKIMPGFRIVFGTESKTGRETLEDGVVTPDGLMKWRNLGGGHAASAAMAVRMGLLELVNRYNGIQYDHIILDEPDAAMRGELEEEFIMLMGRISDTGKTVTMISHNAEAHDIIGSQLILEPGPNGTEVRAA